MTQAAGGGTSNLVLRAQTKLNLLPGTTFTNQGQVLEGRSSVYCSVQLTLQAEVIKGSSNPPNFTQLGCTPNEKKVGCTPVEKRVIHSKPE